VNDPLRQPERSIKKSIVTLQISNSYKRPSVAGLSLHLEWGEHEAWALSNHLLGSYFPDCRCLAYVLTVLCKTDGENSPFCQLGDSPL
jgi:hypothetical protein